MSKQTAAVVVGAIVLFVIAVVGAMAFTGSDGSGGHKMPNGETMTDSMTTGTHTMTSGETMPGTTHSMP